MPNRILKESITTSRTIDQLSLEEERLFYRLLVVCDDYGRFEGEPSIILGRCFPRKIGQITVDEVGRWLLRLIEVGLLHHYTWDDSPYVEFATWERHQQIRTAKSKYPTADPDAADTTFDHLKSGEINCNQLNANVPVIQSNPIQSESESTHSRPSTARQRPVVVATVPDSIRDFDAVLRQWPTYVPSAAFYEQVVESYSHLPLKLEAVKISEWLRSRRKRRCSTAFVLNWLGNAAGAIAARGGNGSIAAEGGRSVARYSQRDHI